MRLIFTCAMAGLLLATFARAAEADKLRAAPSATPPLSEEAAHQLAPAGLRPSPAAPTSGQAENRWRYRFSQGRWWYWKPDHQWSYFDGSRWVPYRNAGGFGAKKVDPALLRLEAKEGVLGIRKWSQAGGMVAQADAGLGWAVSGTRGSIGGAPSSFTNPSPLPRPGGWRASGMGGTPRGR
jgi:hypothetical protein